MQIPGDDLSSRDVVQRHGDRPVLRAGEYYREEEIIPRLGKLPYQHHHKTGDGNWQKNIPVDAHHSRAIDLGGFDQFIGDAGIVVAESQRGDWNTINNMHQNQSGQVSVESDAVHELHQRNEHGLVWNEHAKKD